MASVLVTEGEQRAALAVVRSLGRAGHRVHVTAARTSSLAGSSRHAAGETRVPDPVLQPEPYGHAIHELVRRHGIDVVLPTTEAGALALLDAPPPAVLPLPAAAVFRRVCHKGVVLATARRLAIQVPDQVELHAPESLASVDGLPDFPVVVKPVRSVVETGAGRARTGVSYARDADELNRVLGALRREAFPVLVQRIVRGPGTGVFLLLWEGELLAAFAHRRMREKPPTGGVSVLRESIPLDPELLARSRALLDRFDWQGVAMVEYKVDAATGVPSLMEVNGRFWGSLQLAIDAGVDFPRLLVAAAVGESVRPVLEYRVGVRSRWWWGEVDHLVAVFRGAHTEPRPGRREQPWRAGGSVLRSWLTPARNEVFRWSDPAPFVRESVDWVAQALHR